MKKTKPIKGVVTALVTPFAKQKVDFVSLKKLIRMQMDGGIQGLVVNGTTAESPTLSAEEVEKIFKFVVKETDKSIPILLGSGTNSTKTTIERTKRAKTLGADAALVVVPYYNKPPQRGIEQHYLQVAKLTKMPIIMYNVPGRTVVSMSNQTIIAVARSEYICGVKEASGEVSRVTELRKNTPKGFVLLSGDDATFVDFMLAGGDGVISVISNVLPRQAVEISNQAVMLSSQAKTKYSKYSELNRLLGVEANPIPAKYILYKMGIIKSAEMRLPLVSMAKTYESTIDSELKKLGLI